MILLIMKRDFHWLAKSLLPIKKKTWVDRTLVAFLTRRAGELRFSAFQREQ